MNLYLLQYNNYYNRILKRHNTLSEYLQYSPYEIPIIGITNFNFGDGVSVQQIVNYPYENNMPDYAVAVDSDNNIIGRYFIIDMVYLRKGQYTTTLYRDLLADYYLELLDAPIFVEKGPLNDEDPFIFNNEDITFNQIKEQEELLKDRCGIPWLVGYISPKRDNISITYTRSTAVDETYTSLSDYYATTGGSFGTILQRFGYIVYANNRIYGESNPPASVAFGFNELGKTAINITEKTFGYGLLNTLPNNSNLKMNNPTNDSIDRFLNNMIQEAYNSAGGDYATRKQAIANFINVTGIDKYNRIQREPHKIIYITSTNKYYDVSVKQSLIPNIVSVGVGTQPFETIKSIVNTTIAKDFYSAVEKDGEYNNASFGLFTATAKAELVITEIPTVPTIDKTITLSGKRNVLSDAPYSMFAIPFADNVSFTNGAQTYTSKSKIASYEFVNSLSQALTGSNWSFDVQLLPYCPLQNNIIGPSALDISTLTNEEDYNFVAFDDENTSEGVMILWGRNASFTFNIAKTIANPYNSVKLWNELKTYRICSPNYASIFEFSAAKNNGVEWFNVDCTYKPYSPYIHINPNFKGLYGKDFNDARGLICGGDFSITQLNNAWETYQRNNVNYEKSFQRQIENMEINNKYQRIGEITNAITGTFSGAMSAATTSGLASGGNPYAIAGGAILGGAASLAGGIADIYINDKLRAEALDYTKDQFGYSLGNIKALPTTIAKLASFTANNKIFPVLEIYGTTEAEKIALENKIKYNGMTVMRIGTINEFILYKKNDLDYFKGKLIRLDLGEQAEDFHIVNQISAELNKGVFI